LAAGSEQRIWVKNLQRKIKVNTPQLKKRSLLILNALGQSEASLSLLLVNDNTIQKLNYQFRKLDEATDVLSFPMHSEKGRPGLLILGDLAISVDTAKRQAEKLGHSLEREMTFLLIHGILHLTGWDHERSPGEAKKMYKKQREILAFLERYA
jgi:probable rRNA maturation factor